MMFSRSFAASPPHSRLVAKGELNRDALQSNDLKATARNDIVAEFCVHSGR
jgi:hypothetical protein